VVLCGAAKDLPVMLPDDVTFDTPGNPLDRHPTWKHVECPKCKGKATRETDTCDTFVDSSWYFARFCSPREMDRPVDPAACDYWLPVDQHTAASSMRSAPADSRFTAGHARHRPPASRRAPPGCSRRHGDPRDLSR
jgi:hypothetical protein